MNAIERYFYDLGFDEGYQARGGEMTYVLCPSVKCRHHDGDGCTLEEVELSFKAVFDGVAALYGEPTAMPKCGPACREYEEVKDGYGE